MLTKEELLQKDSKTLATIIIVNRVLGSYRNEAKVSMMILMQRRNDGDKFQFEKFIVDGAKEYKIDINLNLLDDLKQQIFASLANDIVNTINH